MLMWATRLIAGFGAVGLAGEPEGCRLERLLLACFASGWAIQAGIAFPHDTPPPLLPVTSIFPPFRPASHSHDTPPPLAALAAAHEVLRQIWVFSNQFFTSMDIATQVHR